ncbi:MAG: hypothetical protein F6K47_40495, partial [Symploca sp. SIO2E6]|nr:hypothetical protein [Symploca sp. SIO2E6]
MEKVKIIKLLLVLAFVPGLLVGCQSGMGTSEGQVTPSPSPTETPEQTAKAQDLADSFNQLEVAYNEFQPSLETFLTETKNVIDKKVDKPSVDT